MSKYYNRQWRLPNNENKDKQSNYSMNFDGSNSINCGNISSLNGLTKATWSCWYKKTASGSKYFMGNWGANVANAKQFLPYQYSSGMEVYLGNNASGSTSHYTMFSNLSCGISQDTWHHMAFVFDASESSNADKLKFYLNGTQITNSAAGFALTSLNSVTTDFILGAPFSPYLTGNLDAVAIFNYALSSSQVTTLYGSSSTGIGNPMTLSPKPVAYYPLGDQDSFNGSNYLVPNSSLKDYVFSFDGSSNYIDLGTNTFIDTSSSFTISGWYKNDGLTGSTDFDNTFAFKTNSSHSFTSYINNYPGYSPFCFGLADGSSIKMNGGSIPTGWFHLCLVYDGNGITTASSYSLYINNQSQNLTTAGNLGSSGNLNQIGKYNLGNYYNGSISNAQIFNTALPATGSNSVETLYNNGSPLTSMSGFTSLQGWWKLDASATYDSSTTTWTIPDDSTNSNDGTSSGMTQANLVQSDLSFTSGYSPYALDFDKATHDKINFNYRLPTGDAPKSISVWVKAKTLSYTSVVNGGASSTGQYFGLWWASASNGFMLITYGGDASFGFTPLVDTWYHLVISYAGSGNVNLYYNGILGNSTNIGVRNTGNTQFNLGKGGGASSFDGAISNLSAWNTALTSTQVSEIYNEGVPSNLNNHSAYSNLESWWQLGSNSSFNSSLNQWTCIDEKGTNTGESSQTFNEDAIVDGVGSYANGLSSGMGGDEVIGNAPYSTANSLSVNMDVLDRTTDTPS